MFTARTSRCNGEVLEAYYGLEKAKKEDKWLPQRMSSGDIKIGALLEDPEILGLVQAIHSILRFSYFGWDNIRIHV